ncbi:transposase [Gammaproteobacteria bacterium]
MFAIQEQEQLTYAEIASRFGIGIGIGIGIATLTRWRSRLEPKLTRDKPATKINRESLARDVAMHPDAYQFERAKRLGVSRSGIGQALKRMRISYKKKTLSHPKANEEKRTAFQERMEVYEAEGRSIVFVDEAGFAVDMPRRNGYAPIGKRCVGKQDWNAKGRVNAIGALIGMCLVTATLFTGTINSNVFYSWITQDLLPKLPPNCVLVMDNATFHKRLNIQQSIKNAGHILGYLPPLFARFQSHRT